MSLVRFAGTTVAAFLAYGILYTIGEMLIAGDMASMAAHTVPPEQTLVATLAYHLVQTIVFVWLFDKAVGSTDIKDGAVFGAMIGLYLMASDSVWFTNLKDFPQDARMALSVMNIVFGAVVGIVVAKLHGIGRGEAADEG